MLKIKPYYQNIDDLEKAAEPVKSVATILDGLYFRGPGNNAKLSYRDFKNTVAVSCIKFVAEDLAMHQVSFVNRLKTLWYALQNNQKQFSNQFDVYSVPDEIYLGTIFGGVYYVLAQKKSVDGKRLEIIVNFVSGFPRAVPYFNVFKTALIADADTSAPTLPQERKDMAQLRREFIQGLNANPAIIKSIDWADATVGFDRDVMKEIFWGVEDDKTLRIVVKAIISTWKKLSAAKDFRCYEKGGDVVTSLDPMKFGTIFKESINSFFNDLWVERNAKNTYTRFGTDVAPAANVALPAKEAEDEDIADVTAEIHYSADLGTEQLRAELEKAVSEKQRLQDELNAYWERSQNRKGINRLMTAHLGMKLAPLLGIHVTNKKELAPALSKLFGWGQNSLEKQMSKYLSDKEEWELADIFGDLSPDLAKKICPKWQKQSEPDTEVTPDE